MTQRSGSTRRQFLQHATAMAAPLFVAAAVRGQDDAPSLQAVTFGKDRVDFIDHPGPDAAAPVVVLIHGGQCTAADWASVAPRLARRYRVILPDGFVYPLDAWRLWLLLDHLGVARAALLGHSAGGPVIRAMYRLAPQRVWAMIDIDGAAFGKLTLARNLPNDRFSPAAAALYERHKAQMQQLRPGHRGDYPSLVTIERRLTAYERSKIPPQARAAARKIDNLAQLPDAPPAPPAIPDQGKFILCPCLQIQTGRGKLRRADFSSTWVQENFQAREIHYELIEEAGHWPWLEDLDGFLAILEPFLARHADDAGHSGAHGETGVPQWQPIRGLAYRTCPPKLRFRLRTYRR